MDLTLDLNNFQSREAEGSRYVLTSPRSLEACARLRIRPIQLLHKPLEDFIEENPGKPKPLLQVFYDDHELKRAELLRKCKEVRKSIIMEQKVETRKKESREKITAEMRYTDAQNRGKNGPLNPPTSFPGRSKTLPRRNVNREKLTHSKSLGNPGEDINNNTEALYEVIPNNIGEQTPKIMGRNRISPRKTPDMPRPAAGQATFTKTRGKSNINQDAEQPYMISTPKLPTKFSRPKKDLERGRRSLPTVKSNEEKAVYTEISTSRSSRSLVSDRTFTSQRRRSKSVDVPRRKPRKSSEIEMASSLKFSNSNVGSGYSTPQMQRDQKIVEVMKKKRKQHEEDAIKRNQKRQEWDEEKRKEERKKQEVDIEMKRSLAQSHLEWERKLKEKEERRVREEKRREKEKEEVLNQVEKQIERNKGEQERMQHLLHEERKRSFLQRKQQQEAAKLSLEQEVLTFQEATEREVEERLDKARRMKQEKEFQELTKVQLMNKTQRERFLHLQKQVEKRREKEEQEKRETLQGKMAKAEFLHVKKIEERDRCLKLQAKEEDERIQQTRKNQEKIIQEADEYHKTIAEQKKEQLKRANMTALKNIQEKAERAQQKRMESQEEHKRKLKEIEKEDELMMEQTKEFLAVKENRAKTHQQLKETAIRLSRANARASEIARLEVKRKDETFLEGVKQVELAHSIGRGVRTGYVNASSVKFG